MKRGGLKWDWAKEQMQIRGSIEKSGHGVPVGLFLDQGVVEAVHQCRLGRASSEQRCIVANRILEIRADGGRKERDRAGAARWTEGGARDGRERQDEQD
jgi:hypothetical protein